ncbi:hypothetical protein ElyMa_001144100 [Elysia marginata]|uniref:Uncharacterized protein n=1 Tax=Elysia marginata TaxID=1093978 RepID=A0AAV4HYB1_9GAST|nr:hypothetical protein ElyMa_001144100 [Elysia marginata]
MSFRSVGAVLLVQLLGSLLLLEGSSSLNVVHSDSHGTNIQQLDGPALEQEVLSGQPTPGVWSDNKLPFPRHSFCPPCEIDRGKGLSVDL